ncbi:hypothetical protein NIES4103_06160 [Nostoc sp. NIES-4103]|nr:hypothetical protein NIES4103_06160 [Nostoc sp. NIES-4103]
MLTDTISRKLDTDTSVGAYICTTQRADLYVAYIFGNGMTESFKNP